MYDSQKEQFVICVDMYMIYKLRENDNANLEKYKNTKSNNDSAWFRNQSIGMMV